MSYIGNGIHWLVKRALTGDMHAEPEAARLSGDLGREAGDRVGRSDDDEDLAGAQHLVPAEVGDHLAAALDGDHRDVEAAPDIDLDQGLADILRGHLELGPSGCRVHPGRFSGPSFSFEEQRQLELPAGGAVRLTNAFGSVSVRGGGSSASAR